MNKCHVEHKSHQNLNIIWYWKKPNTFCCNSDIKNVLHAVV